MKRLSFLALSLSLCLTAFADLVYQSTGVSLGFTPLTSEQIVSLGLGSGTEQLCSLTELISCEKHEYGHYQQHLRLGPAYLPVVGVPSLLSASHLTGSIPHKMRWFEVDASRRGAEHFDKKYGRGKEGYEQGSADFFDINSFKSGNFSPYINPRNGLRNKNLGHPISGADYSALDYLIPSIFLSLFIM